MQGIKTFFRLQQRKEDMRAGGVKGWGGTGAGKTIFVNHIALHIMLHPIQQNNITFQIILFYPFYFRTKKRFWKECWR